MPVLSNNKRHYARVPLSCQVLLHLDGKKHNGYVSNISPGGLYLIEIQPELPSFCIGQQGVLFFDDSNQEKGIACKIMRIDNSNVGVSFSGI